jgi:uncharacterized protein DUF3105
MRRFVLIVIVILACSPIWGKAAAVPQHDRSFDLPVVVLTTYDLASASLKARPKLPEASGGATPTVDELLSRVETFDNLSRQHTEDTVEYDQNPPVGGMHSPVLQNCQFYDAPVGNEHAVHSLEHGAVWITYDPDLPASDIAKLEALAEGHDHLLISPYEGLPSPVVASAWGVQLQLDGVDDPFLTLFIDYFEQGPQTPEPGAACSGGTSETVVG